MKGRDIFRRGVAAVVSAALVLTAPGGGAYQAFAQEFAQVPRGVAMSGLGSAGVAGSVASGVAIPAAPVGPSALQAPVRLDLPVAPALVSPAARQSQPTLPVSAAAPVAAARNAAAAKIAPARHATAAAPVVAARAPAGNVAQGRFSAAVVERAADAKRPAFGLFRMLGGPDPGLGGAAAGTGASEKTLVPSGETLGSSTRSKSWAEKIFSFAKDAAPAADETPADTQGRMGELRPNAIVPAAPQPGAAAESKPVEQLQAAKAPPAERRPSGLRKLIKGVLLAGVTAATAAGFVALYAVPVLHHPLLSALGVAGMWVGNLLAVAYPIPEIYKTFREGSAKSTPVGGAVAGTAAPLAQGLISAPVKGMQVWGLQNLFGAATTFAPLVFGRYLKGPVSKKQAAIRTAVTVAISGALSFGLYAAATAVVPGLVTAGLGAAATCYLMLGIQAAAFAGFVYIFGPTITDLLRGKAPRAFSPAFSLTFALASAGFVAWMLQAGLAAPPQSSDRLWSLIYAAQNVALFAVSFISYLYSKRAADAPTRAVKWVTPPALPGGIYGVILGTIIGLALAPVQPMLALAAPLFGWALGGAFKDGKMRPDDGGAGNGPFFGLALGTLAAAALAAYGLPIYYMLALPFMGALAGWRLAFKRNVPILAEDFPAAEEPKTEAASETPAPQAPAAEPEAVKAAEPVVEPAPTPAPAPEAPRTPPAFSTLPKDARETTVPRLLELKAKAQAKARKLAKDARLVTIAINLDDSRAHWMFIFQSEASRKRVIVRATGVEAGPMGKKLPPLRDSRLERLVVVEKAYTELKAGKRWFKPARLEISGRWKGDPEYVFTDAGGRVAKLPLDKLNPPAPPQAPEPAPAPAPETPKLNLVAAEPAARAPPRSWKNLPVDARAMTAPKLLEEAAKAQARARKLAPDARLVRVAANLDDPRGHWIFVFRSDKQRKLLTVWQKRIGVERLEKGASETLWTTRLAKLDGLEGAYKRLKAEKHWFVPARVEIVPRWKGDPDFLFIDARGRVARIAGPSPAELPQPPPPENEKAPDPPNDGPQGGGTPPRASLPTPPAPETGSGGSARPTEPEKPPVEPPADGPPRAKEVPNDYKAVHEDFFGFRSVRGLRHDPALKALPLDADTPRIIEQISKQFNIPMPKLRDLASRYRIPLDAPRERWLSVYDRLQRANRAEFANLDGRKYQGFRKLANVRYADGWRGLLQRSTEMHKHFVGFFFRLWYHLFDSFVFGYFRRAIAFRLYHSTEDFLSVPKPKRPKGEPEASDPSKWLEAALSAESFRIPGAQDRILSGPWARALNLSVVECFVMPLSQFVWRRATLAVMSAVAMGILAAFTPFLPFLSVSLTAVPVLGPLLLGVANGLPALVAAVPFVGPAFAPVVDATIHALVGDLILGPMLNTLILTTMLTYPAAVKRRLMDSRGGEVRGPPVFSAEFVKAAALTLVSWDFWRENGKSWFGMMTVGAEIEGVMKYAGTVDSFIDQAWSPVTGGHFKLFHTIGAAVERPADHPDAAERSPIPFGGAITWGNSLIYKLQDLTGFNISDATYKLVSTGIALIHSNDVSRAGANSVVGSGVSQFVTQTSQARDGQRESWEAELRQARENLARLEAGLTGKLDRLRELQAQSNPVTPEERAELERLRKALDGKTLQEYAEAKLAEINDLKNPKEETAERLLQLKKLQEEYEAVIKPETTTAGYAESLAAAAASLHGLQEKLRRAQNPENPGSREAALGTAAQVDPQTQSEIEKLVKEIEQLRVQSQGELANERAQAQLLSALNRLRNAALRERRDGDTTLEFRKNSAKLATVMDLALGIKEAEAALVQLQRGLDLTDSKLKKIDDARRRAAEAQAEADRNRQNLDGWRDDAQRDINDDNAQKSDMARFENQTGVAVERIGTFQADLTALLARLDAEAAGSGNALAEYRRRIALLPNLVEWKTNGKPGDPDYRSLKSAQDDLTTIQDYIVKIDKGLADLANAPTNFGPYLILLVPGVPDAGGVNHDLATTQRILSERKAYWQEKLRDYVAKRDDVAHRLDGNYNGTEVDDFGDAYPISLPRRLGQAQDRLRQSQGEVQGMSSRIDELAGRIASAVPGASLPPLSGLTLEQLKTALETYPDRLSAIKTPNDDSDATFQGKMDLLSIGKLVPSLANATINWAKSDAEVEGIQKAMSTQLPPIRAGLDRVVLTMQNMVADVDKDIAVITQMQQGTTPSESNQAIIDRKRALLEDARGTVQTAQGFVRDQLIPLIRDSIDSVKPGGDDYNKLFDAQIKLYEGTQSALDETLPWALAAKGAAKGDVGGGLAGIQEQRAKYQKFMDGYEENGVRHKGIQGYQLELQQRKDPNFAGMEDFRGEQQPFSLPRKIAQYSQERVTRAQQFNQQASEINQILAQIDQLTANRFSLVTRFTLPTDLDGNNPASIARLQALVDQKLCNQLGDALTAIGDEYKDKGPDPNIDSGEGIPTGPQPSPTLPPDRQVALLALQAARRLVPTSLQDPQGAAATYAMARALYSDAIVEGATKALNEQIPAAERFLAEGAQTLQNAIADLANDEAYVRSNGSSESPRQVVDRSLAVYRALNAFTRKGVEFFGLKGQWDLDALKNLDKIQEYLDGVSEINQNAQTASDSEEDAIRKIRDALKKTYDELAEKRDKLRRWMGQLNRPEESALKRVAEDLRKIQEETRVVLERNLEYHEMEEQHERSREALDWTLHKLDKAQNRLNELLGKVPDRGALKPELLARLDKMQTGGGAWLLDDTTNATQALVVPKANFSYFLDQLFTAFRPDPSGQNLAGLKREILANPQNLTQLIPDSKVVDFGDNADGFYLVYQSQFSVPNGLETSNMVTLGNLAKIGGNNISVSGYTFASPANELNAPWGDKGVIMQVESIQGKNWVNYFEVDLHRFIQDYPTDASVGDQAKQSRLRVFNDHAELLFGGKLYVALTGFGDFAVDNTWEKPYYYGGSGKASWKFNEVLSLNAEEQQIWAKDPRWFEERVNLDFSGWDQDLNQDLIIRADADNKHYRRDQLGPSLNVAKLLNSEDAFTIDFFVARQSGTDDYDQTSGGVAIVKGFTIKDSEGKPWAVINNRATGEMGQAYNSFADRVSVTLPDQGLVFSAEGRLVGDAKTYMLEAQKRTGDHSTLGVSYGSRYIGAPNRLTISMNTSFTLGELWRAVAHNAAEDTAGGEVLKKFNAEMNDFYERQADDRMVQQMRAALAKDVGMKLLAQDMGILSREIQELRRKGAFMDNSRVRGMVGFVTNPISEHLGDRLVGGGFSAGTFTEMKMVRPPKALIESKTPELVEAGLRLQERALARIKAVEAAVTDVAVAQWQLKLARYAALNGQSPALKAEGEAKVQAAVLELDQALIRFNLMTGRSPSEAFPFGDLSARDLEALVAELEKLAAAPDRVTQVLNALDRSEVEKALGEAPMDLMKWVPWVDEIAVTMGVQFQDMLANQALMIGGRVRLPIYDPSSKEKDNAYVIESKAVEARIFEHYQAYGLQAQKERHQALAAATDADIAQPRVRGAANDLRDAIRGYRNGLTSEERLRGSFERWEQYQGEALRGRASAALAQAWSNMDASYAKPAPNGGEPVSLTSFAQAFDLASRNSRDLAEVGFREQAAAAMTKANSHRIEKVRLDVSVGAGLTADGVGWIPSIGPTGFGITPVLGFELKPEELKELQVKQGEAEGAMYQALRTQLEINLAVQFFQNASTAKATQASYWTYQNQIIPALERALAEAQASAAPGSDRAQRAQRALDEARGARDQVWLSHRNAVATLNYLLGRDPDAELAVDISPEQALAELKSILAEKNPVATQRRILEARVTVAQQVETIADKDLKSEELRLEPVSLVVRSLGRLLNTLSEEGIGNPDLVAATRVNTLQAERAKEAWEAGLSGKIQRVAAELDLARARRDDAARSSTPQAKVELLRWANQVRILESDLAMLGATLDEGGGDAAVPLSFAELQGRLRAASQRLAATMRPDDPAAFDPEVLQHQSSLNLRYWFAHQSLNKVIINQGFVEGWVEVRLKSPTTPPEVLLALAKLRMDKAERLRQTDLATARAEADILLSQFETDVRLLRWAQGSPRGAETRGELESRLKAQSAVIAAQLGLPRNTPLEALARLVPADPAGEQSDLPAVADRFIQEARTAGVDGLRRTVFEAGIPESLGNEDGLTQQLRADVIAERMSYKGFTPVVAFGYFRGRQVGGLFLEAPDPRAIERGLTQVLNDSLRKELLSQGRMQELTLRLHLLMTGVQDKAVLLEHRRAAVREAEANFRSVSARYGQKTATWAEVEASRQAVARSWGALMNDAASLKNDFIQLVTELEALGYSAKDRFAPTPRSSRDAVRLQKDSTGEFVRYASKRMLDEGFAKSLDERLAGMGDGIDPRVRAALAEAGARYRKMDDSARTIRAHDLDAAEKLDLLQQADVEGARQKVEALLVQTVAGLGRLDPRSNPGWKGVLEFLADDVRAQTSRADAEWTDSRQLLGEMRDAFWHAVPRELAAEGAFQTLEKLAKAKAEAQQTLLADYLGTSLEPGQFLMRDLNLDAYLRAQADYDAAVLKTFESAEVKGDRALAVGLNAMHPLGEALARQRALAKHGRGMAAVDALIMLEQGRLAALRFERAAPADVNAIAFVLSRLQETKARWEKADPAGLEPLFAVTEVDSGGRRLWTVQGWHTQEEVAGYIKSGRAEVKDGRIWLSPGPKDTWTGKRELVGGVDAAEAQRNLDRRLAVDNERSLSVHETLAANPFALATFDGRVRRGLDHQELMHLAAKGRLFHFSTEAESRTGLKPSVHPLVAFLDRPDRVATVFYAGDRPLSRDHFPTWESLVEHRARLAASSNPDDQREAERFLIVKTGEKGALELMERAKTERLKSLRVGWTEVKLGSYGFALDADGKLQELYLAKEDFDAYHKALEHASETLAKAKAAVPVAEAAVQASEKEASRLRGVAEEERVRLDAVEKAVEVELKPAIEKALHDQGLRGEELARRVADELRTAVVQDRRFKKAQALYADKAKAADEAETKASDARQTRDKALDAVEGAELLVTRSKSWRLFVTRDVGMGFGPANLTSPDTASEENGRRPGPAQELVSVSAQPVFGSKPLADRWGEREVRTLTGELLAAVLDEEGRALKLFLDKDDVERAGETWTIETVGAERFPNGGRTIDPNFRLSHYVDPATGRPVLISRRFMIERLEDSKDRLGSVKHWGVMPWRWVDLALEIPRGIAKTPIELFTGRDPRQEGYLGRVNMYKTEGGMTDHHGLARRVLGVLDILDLMPDPVRRAYDPSQFPNEVQLDDPIRPGENIQGKDARAVIEEHGKARDVDVHFGRGNLERTVRYEVEDLVNAKTRVFTYFEGGARTAIVESRRGRNGQFETSRVIEDKGRKAIDAALNDPVVKAGRPMSDTLPDDAVDADPTKVRDVVVRGEPGHLEVDQVVKRVTVRPGADQFEATEGALGQFGKEYAATRERDRQAAPGLRDAAATSEAALRDALARRGQAVEETAKLWEEHHRLAWRIARQEALEAEIGRLEREIAAIRDQIDAVRRRIRELEELLGKKPDDPSNPNDPTNPNPWPSTWWHWVLAGFFLAALIAALWHWLRRRRSLLPAAGRAL